VNDVFLFNEIIGHLGLLELPLKGRRFTWSNMQAQPLLEQLDWFFTSQNKEGGWFRGINCPLSEKEMDEVVKQMPIDRAPGPDGFNGLFLKKCWRIIIKDFYKLAEDLYNGSFKLQNINGSYISLVPKKQVSLTVNDFRPISLTNVCVKFLTIKNSRVPA
jgi:hypothetical protein